MSAESRLSVRPARGVQGWTPSDKWLGWLVPLLLLACWELAGRNGLLPRYLVSPSVIIQSWLAMAADGELMANTTASLFRQSVGTRHWRHWGRAGRSTGRHVAAGRAFL